VNTVIESSFGTLLNLKYTGPTLLDTIGTIQCSTIDGATTGITVAMPWLLRIASYDSLTINTITYSYNGSFIRDASPDIGTDWSEELYMPYNVGDIITVVANDGSVTDIANTVTIPYVELCNNRVWLRSCS
jgi:hypothetical protein